MPFPDRCRILNFIYKALFTFDKIGQGSRCGVLAGDVAVCTAVRNGVGTEAVCTVDTAGNFTSRKKLDDFFANFFTNGDAAADSTHYLAVQNTLALEMNEGFKKWVKTGMRLFAKHEFARFTLPDVDLHQKATIFNYFTVGAQLLRENAHTLRILSRGPGERR